MLIKPAERTTHMTEVKNEMTPETNNSIEEKLDQLRVELLSSLSDDVKAKLDTAISDVQACQILADSGFDLEKFEKKIEDAGVDMKKIGLQLPDENLDAVSGGFNDGFLEGELVCACGASARDDFSRQFWLGMTRNGRYYRCKKCNRFLAISGKGNVWIYDNIEHFNRHHEEDEDD